MPRGGRLHDSRQLAVGLPNNSVSRIAAQVVIGVGFLGASAIIQDRGGVHGLTTAATIWLVASIGMACGAGFYYLGVMSTAAAILVLLGLVPLSKRLDKRSRKRKSNAPAQEK